MMNKSGAIKQNDLPSGWRVVRLGDVIVTNESNYNIKDDWTFINYLDTGNITENNISNIQSLNTKTDKIPSRAKRKIKVGDIIYSTVRPNQRHYGIVKKYYDNLLVSTGFTTIRAIDKIAYTPFIYWFLTQNKVVSYLQTIGEHSTSTYPSIKSTDIEKINLNLPPLPEQKAIAHILGKLDDKIELNRQINQTLETMAQTLFKSWFVDFDPVIDNAIKAGNKIPKPLQHKADKRKTTKSTLPKDLQSLFPNSFVFNNTLKKWIPQGWEVNKIGDLAEYISKGTTPTKTDIKDKESTIYFLKVRNISNDGNISDKLDLIPKEIHYKQLKRSILKEDDILFSIAGTIGRVAIVPHKLDGSNCNQAIAFIRLKNIKKYKILIHQWLISKISQNTISSKIVQAVQANVSLGTISELEIISPNLKVLSVWNIKLIDIYKKIDSNKEQIKTLTKLRDNLLPKLISGKIRVSEEH